VAVGELLLELTGQSEKAMLGWLSILREVSHHEHTVAGCGAIPGEEEPGRR
jgi:hypothetical protein